MAQLLYLISYLNEPPAVGDVAEIDYQRDLHLTLVPAFSIPDEQLPVLKETIGRICTWFRPIAAPHKEQTLLGVDKNIPALLLDGHHNEPHSINNFHNSLVDAIQYCDGRFNDTYWGEDYKPHISWYTPDTQETVLDTLTLIHHTIAFGVGVKNLATWRL